jgi:hypothetical protein
MQNTAIKTVPALSIPTVAETTAFFIVPPRDIPVLIKDWDKDEVNGDYYFSTTND